MSVSRLIIGASLPAIHDKTVPFARSHDKVARFLEGGDGRAARCPTARSHLPRAAAGGFSGKNGRRSHRLAVSGQQVRGGFDSECGIVEQCNPAVGMRHGEKKSQHGRHYLSQPARKPFKPSARIFGANIEQVETVFENHAVIHGTSLEVPSIREDLLIELIFQHFGSPCQPSARAVSEDSPQKRSAFAFLKRWFPIRWYSKDRSNHKA